MNLNIDYILDLLKYEKLKTGLYIVSTPIGNLGDITLRCLKILSCSDLIICEDTRVSKKLTTKYSIKTPLKSFHKFNSRNSVPRIISQLKKGLSIALISDAGTPLISDPGIDLVSQCVSENINIFSIPGPSAPVASLVLSNFASPSFSFRGFFPRENKAIKKELEILKKSIDPIIYFESPKRIIQTLEIISTNKKNYETTFVRELTKKNEEVINTKISKLIDVLSKRKKIQGEITFIIKPEHINLRKPTNKEILLASKDLKVNGLNISEISKILSKDLNVSKREIYQLLIKNK